MTDREITPPLETTPQRVLSGQRMAFLCIAAIFVMTPFAIARQLDRPSVSQRYFFELAAFSGVILYSAGRLLGLFKIPPRDLLRTWLILYVIALSVGAAFSPHPRPVFLNLIFPLSGIAFYVVVFAFPWDRIQIVRLLSCLAVTVYAASSIGVIQGALGAIPDTAIKVLPYADRQIPGHMDVLSVFGHPNYATSFLGPALILLSGLNGWRRQALPRPSLKQVIATSILATAVIIACAMLWQTSGTLYLIIAVAAGIMAWLMRRFIHLTIISVLLSLLMAGSRGVWLALAVALVVMLPLWARTRNWQIARLKSLSWRIVLAVMVATAVIAMSPLRSYVQKRLHEQQAVASRLYGYTIAVDMLRERPWRGYGYGSFGTEYFDRVVKFQKQPGSAVYRNMLIDMNGTPPGEVHNDLLAIAIDGGLPATFSLLGFFLAFTVLLTTQSVRFARLGLHSESSMLISMLGAIICIMIDGLFSFPLRLPCSALMFWGIAAIGSRLAQEALTPGS